MHTPFSLYEATDGALTRTSQLLWFRIAKTMWNYWKDDSKPLFCISSFSYWTSRCNLRFCLLHLPSNLLRFPWCWPVAAWFSPLLFWHCSRCCLPAGSTGSRAQGWCSPREGKLKEECQAWQSNKQGQNAKGPKFIPLRRRTLVVWLASLKVSCTIELLVTKTSDGGTWKMSPLCAF